jgi:hypothetical protein
LGTIDASHAGSSHLNVIKNKAEFPSREPKPETLLSCGSSAVNTLNMVSSTANDEWINSTNVNKSLPNSTPISIFRSEILEKLATCNRSEDIVRTVAALSAYFLCLYYKIVI